MKQLSTTCRTLTASLFITSGLLAAVAVEPADAIRVRRKTSSTDGGSFEIDYELDYTSVDESGVPNAGTLTSLEIMPGNVAIDTNFQPLIPSGLSIPSFQLLAEDAQTSIEFSNDCSIESCNSSIDLESLISSASGFSFFSPSEIEDGLIETQYSISFSGEFSDEVPTDPNGITGITQAQREEGVDGSIEVFFSQPDEDEESIFSFGFLDYTSTLPDFLSVNLSSSSIGFVSPDLFPPLEPVDNREPTDVPEPSVTVSLLALGAAYGMRKGIRRLSENSTQQRSA